MNKLLALLLITISISCTGQDKSEIVTLDHSPVDTAASFKRKDYTLYTYIPDNFPLKGGTEFWLVPKDTINRYELTASNAMVIPSTTGIKICVIPKAESLKLSVRKNGKLAEKIDFKIIELKKPLMAVYSKQGLVKNESIDIKTDSIFIKLEQPDLKYKRIYPKDCRYTCDSLIVSVVRGGKTIDTLITKNRNIPLHSLKLQKNDKLNIEIINAKRVNFINQLFPINEKFKKEYLIIEQ